MKRWPSSLEKKAADADRLKEKLKGDRALLDRQTKALEKLNFDLDKEKTEAKTLEGSELKKQEEEGKKEKLETRFSDIRTLKKAVEEVQKKEEELESKEKSYSAIYKKTTDLKTEYDQMYAKFLAGQAGKLAEETHKKLDKDGTASCPVCGTKLIRGQEVKFTVKPQGTPAEEEVEQSKKEWETSEKNRNDQYVEKEKLSAEIRSEKENTQTLAERCLGTETKWETLVSEGFINGKIDAFQSDAVQESTVFNPGDLPRQGDADQTPAPGEGAPADDFQARRKFDCFQCGTVVKGTLPNGSDRPRKEKLPEACAVLECLFRDGSDGLRNDQ